MKNAALALAATLILAASSVSASSPQYAGKWVLDREKSVNLPRYYEHITAHILEVEPSENALTVNVAITRGGETDRLKFDYTLDGREQRTETPVRTPNGRMMVPATLRARVADNGNLLITIDRELEMGGVRRSGRTDERWELVDAKTLLVHRVDEMPNGTMESTMAFVRE